MKTKLKIGMLLLAIIMALGAISLTSCSNDDNLWPDDLILPEDEILGSEIYMFKYKEEYTYLREIIGVTPSPDEDYISSQYPGFYSKSYRTNLGDIVITTPKISVIAKDDMEIDNIIQKFGDKLTFKKTIGKAYIYNCNVENSDEVMRIVTKLAKDKRVIGCEAMYIANIELNTNSPYSL